LEAKRAEKSDATYQRLYPAATDDEKANAAANAAKYRQEVRIAAGLAVHGI
jgi:hypothetical protein